MEADGEDPAVCPGCPLARVNHALAMNEKDFITLMHDVKRHEDALMEMQRKSGD
jgi:hypothetical protein